MRTIQKQLLSRMIAAALAVGVGAPALAQERPANDYSEEQQAIEQDEVRRVGRSRQSSEDVELQAAQAQAAQQVQGQGQGQEYSPERPNPRALEVRQSEEAHARNAEREAQREAEGAQRQAGQGRWLQERQADQDQAQQQLQVEQVQGEQQRQVEQMQTERLRQGEQLHADQQRQAEQGREQEQREAEQQRQVNARQMELERTQVERRADGRRFEEFHERNGGLVEEQAPQRRIDERVGRNNPRETPALREASRLPERDRQRLILQQRQSVDQYRREVFADHDEQREYAVALQYQNRMQQSRYQQRYWQRQHDMQSRWSSQRFNYDTNPYFYTRASYRYQRGGRYYEVNRYAADLLQQAINYGYEEGVRAGEADRYDRWRGGYRDNYAYIDANFGYEGYYVSQRDYNHYFREGFRRGYEDGYGRQYRYGRYGNGVYSIQPSVLSLILRLEPFG